MSKKTEITEQNFFSWFLSGNEKREKLISFFVLFLEIILLTVHAIRENSFLICCTVNLIFLLYFLYDFSSHFNEEFLISDIDKVADSLPQFKSKRLRKPEVMIYAFRANESIKQLKSFKGFLISTIIIYLILILDYLKIFSSASQPDLYSYIISLLINAVSYIGALYILKCFYVLYYPSFNNQFQSTVHKIDTYWFVILVLIVFEALIEYPRNNVLDIRVAFVFQFLCSTLSSFVLILLFARFENRLLGITPAILAILYIYAIIQTSLPIATGEINKMINDNILTDFFKSFKSYLLLFALIGKLFLYNIFVYLYRTKRVFYYFLMIKAVYDAEKSNWKTFDNATVLDEDI
jgi:hypothetical protein